MNLHRYFYLFLRNSWILVLLVAAALGAAWAWVNKQPLIYGSRAALEVELPSVNPLGNRMDTIQSERYLTMDSLNTDVQALTSNSVLVAVANSIGLSAEWAAKDPSGKVSSANQSSLAAVIRAKLNVALRRGTRIIDITAEDEDPERARVIAAAVVDEFMKEKQAERKKDIDDVKAPLQNEVNRLKDKLDQAQKELADWPTKNNAVSVEESINLANGRIKDLDKQASEGKLRLAILETDLTALDRTEVGNLEEMLKLESVRSLPEVALLRGELIKERSAFEALKERYKEKHPKYITAVALLTDYENKLKEAVAKAGDTLRQQHKTLLENRTKVEEMLAKENEALLALNKKLIPYNMLKEQLKADQEIYTTLLTSNNQVNINPDLLRNKYRLKEEALLIPKPIRPNKTKTLVIAGLVALALGIGLILLLDRLDTSIRTVDDAEKLLELPVLAAVPEDKEANASPVIGDKPGSAQAEAFRSLRAAISLLGDESNRRILLVTSAVPSEGKTYTSLNLAAALAGQGYRTLIVDADLRRPTLSAGILDRDTRGSDDYKGLSDILSGLCSLKDATVTTETEGLFLLPGGHRPPNPAELLAQSSVPKLLEEMLANYDRVVLDSAPIHAVSDSLSLAQHVHAVCLVVRFGKTPRRIAQRAIEVLKKSGARMAGLVMNRMPTKRGASYYYYYYGDPYVKDSVYGGDKKSKSRKPQRRPAVTKSPKEEGGNA